METTRDREKHTTSIAKLLSVTLAPLLLSVPNPLPVGPGLPLVVPGKVVEPPPMFGVPPAVGVVLPVPLHKSREHVKWQQNALPTSIKKSSKKTLQ